MRRHPTIVHPRPRTDPPPSLPSVRHRSPSKPQSIDAVTWMVFLLLSCALSFYGGAWMAWTLSPPRDCNPDGGAGAPSDASALRGPHDDGAPPDCSEQCAEACLDAVIGGKGALAKKLDGKLDAIVQRKIDRALEEDCPKIPPGKKADVAAGPATNDRRFPKSVSHFATGLASVNRKEMFDAFPFGVPMDAGADEQDILMLYNTPAALPGDESVAAAAKAGGDVPHMDAADATANCDQMNVIFVKPPDRSPFMEKRQCVAVVGGQYQGYHVQRWMRVVGEGPHGKIDRRAPLRLTGRMTKTDGYDELLYPKANHLALHRNIMTKYLNNYEKIRKELGDVLKRIAVENTVIVTTVNMGQSELLMNLVCSSRARGFDMKNMLVFPTDEFSRDLAEGMGIASYYAQKLVEDIPKEEAARYGDTTFGHIMMAKVICVHLVSDLGYDLLFQDVDVIWYKDPLKLFHDKDSAIANYDVYFQDDGNRQERYTPWSANSGFYYIRNNPRTQQVFRSMLYAGDLIFACRSHQQILIQLLAEANSLTGLRVKVLSRDEDDFPGGFHYHMRKDYMKKWLNGKVDPYVFHMCWTLNKEDKLMFMRQMGMWYVNDECIGKGAAKIAGGGAGGGVLGACCTAEPLFSCHYRDKPSIKSCADSPPKDKGKGSFW